MANRLSFLSQTYDLHLLLEDVRTCDYFSTLFNAESSIVQMVSVGGADGVNGLVTISWGRDSLPSEHAFGWVDRDYGRDNVISWSNPETHVFRGKRHEIENYLLDWTALAHCNLAIRYKKTNVHYRDLAHNIAKEILYQVVCEDVLYEFQSDYTEGFPCSPANARPRCDVENRQDLERYLLNHDWLHSGATRAINLFSEEALRKRIDLAEQRYRDALASTNDEWRIIFPGKQIFERLKTDVYCGGRKEGGTIAFSDLVKSIATYQAENAVPEELKMFMDELKKKRVA